MDECNGISLKQAMELADKIWTGQLTVKHADRRAIAGALKRLALSVDVDLLEFVDAETEGYLTH